MCTISLARPHSPAHWRALGVESRWLGAARLAPPCVWCKAPSGIKTRAGRGQSRVNCSPSRLSSTTTRSGGRIGLIIIVSVLFVIFLWKIKSEFLKKMLENFSEDGPGRLINWLIVVKSPELLTVYKLCEKSQTLIYLKITKLNVLTVLGWFKWLNLN